MGPVDLSAHVRVDGFLVFGEEEMADEGSSGE